MNILNNTEIVMLHSFLYCSFMRCCLNKCHACINDCTFTFTIKCYQGNSVFCHFHRCQDWYQSRECKALKLSWSVMPASIVFPPNLFRGQRAMMHIPGSSSGEAFQPLFVIVHSCRQPAFYLSHSRVKRYHIFHNHSKKSK